MVGSLYKFIDFKISTQRVFRLWNGFKGFKQGFILMKQGKYL